DTAGILAAAAAGELDALVVGGVDPDDLPDPQAARAALDTVGFVVSLEMRPSAVTERADVVLPIAPTAEKAGTFRNWEGRDRPFDVTLQNTGALPDCRVLDTLAVEMDVDLFTQTPKAAWADFDRAAGAVPRTVEAFQAEPAAAQEESTNGHVKLSTWRQLIDNGSLQVEEPHLAGTARPAVIRLNAATAERHGVV